MKLKIQIKRITAVILAITMMLSAVPVTYVHAGEQSSTVKTLIAEIKKRERMPQGLTASNSAGDWKTAKEHDHLARNYFHLAVQDDIVSKNEGIQKELDITYGPENDTELQGKTGRADLYLEDDKNKCTYLWEIKPFSYSKEYKRSKGINQLAQYIASEPDKYKIGEDQIKNGTVYRDIIVENVGKTEYVRYTIDYYNMQNGIILYKFKRDSHKKEDNTGAVVKGDKDDKDKNKDKPVFPSKKNAVDDILSPGRDEDKGGIAAINLYEMTKLVAVSKVWGDMHKKINASPNTSNTLSQAIILECSMFQLSVAKVYGESLTSPETVNAAEINEAVDRFKLALESYGGSGIMEELRSEMTDGDVPEVEELLKEIQGESENFDKAGKAQPPSDPLIIDLGTPGIELCPIRNGVYFDLDNNGFDEKTAWIGSEDGFLVLDRNGNGVIDNGGELFGDQVIRQGDARYSSGFEALAGLDANKDKVIDADDAVFDSLKIWIDADHNGVSEAEELKSLNDSGVVSISLDYRENSLTDGETGTRMADTAGVKINNNSLMQDTSISEFWFPVDSSDTTQGGAVTAGNVQDLFEAICEDETGELYKLCLEFGETEDVGRKRCCLKKILYFITGASDVPADSRGGNIDARDLKVIEQFMGRGFEGVGGADPNTYAAPVLKDIYNKIEDEYYNVLNMYCGLGGYLNTVYEYEDGIGERKLEWSFLQYLIDSKISRGENVETLVYDLGVYLKSYDDMNDTDYFSGYLSHYSETFPQYAWVVRLAGAVNTYLGTDINDSYKGTAGNDIMFAGAGNDIIEADYGDDILYGEDGDDTLYGYFGEDKLYGGRGNDKLYGGNEDDIYYFDIGDGEDEIYETGIDPNADSIVFGDGISAGNVALERVGNDLVIGYGDGDKITVKNAYLSKKYSEYFVEYVRFADGTEWDVKRMTGGM